MLFWTVNAAFRERQCLRKKKNNIWPVQQKSKTSHSHQQQHREVHSWTQASPISALLAHDILNPYGKFYDMKGVFFAERGCFKSNLKCYKQIISTIPDLSHYKNSSCLRYPRLVPKHYFLRTPYVLTKHPGARAPHTRLSEIANTVKASLHRTVKLGTNKNTNLISIRQFQRWHTDESFWSLYYV